MKKLIYIVMAIVVIGLAIGVVRTKTGPKTEPLIHVTSPQNGATVTSPISISGEARGTWYFEASFPIVILGSTGETVGEGHAEAKGDWMTEDFVPFEATVTFTAQPAGSSGTIVLKNDNPSGDPARDKFVTIPVKF